MSTPLRNIALVGASGHLGPHLLAALQADPTFRVTVITRETSRATFPPSTTVVRVSDDYPKPELVSAFTGHDAVILSLNFQAEKYHDAMVDASIEAGVKRLVPSIFGGRHTDAVQDIFPFAKSKAELLEYVARRAAETDAWSFTGVFTGLFHELCAGTGFYGIDAKGKTATLWDEGNVTFSVSTYGTIAHGVVGILKRPEETRNAEVYISSFETSLNELLDVYKGIDGEEGWTVERKGSEEGVVEAKKTMQSAQDFMTRMRAIGRLALLSSVKKDIGANFVAEGLSWNGKLGLERKDVRVVTRKILEA